MLLKFLLEYSKSVINIKIMLSELINKFIAKMIGKPWFCDRVISLYSCAHRVHTYYTHCTATHRTMHKWVQWNSYREPQPQR